MPAGQDYNCRACGHQAVATMWLEYRLDDGTFTSLQHPEERQDLARLGTSENQALDDGRFYQTAVWACPNCLRLITHREQIVPGRYFWRPAYTKAVLYTLIAYITVIGFYDVFIIN